MARVRVTRFDFYAGVARRVGANAGYDHVLRTTIATAITASREVPVLTAKLRLSQRYRVRRVGLNTHGTIWYPVDYAMSVHEGATAHEIVPRDPNGWLVFPWHGRIRYAKRVWHPGQDANPWLFRSLVREAGRRGFRVVPR
jgi:hypothetical protein